MTTLLKAPRIATAMVALCVWGLTMAIAATGAAAAGDGGDFLFKDKFDSGNYNGNAGPDDFQGPWFEYQDWGGAGKGAVSVESGGDCPNDRCARIMGDDETLAGKGLARWANLDGAATARIKFKYSQDVDSGAGGIRVVVNDGRDWQTVYDVAFDDEDDRTYTKTIAVSQYANTDFAIGFFAYGHLDGTFYIDDVEIFGAWDSPTTTTSPPSTTTTTAPPTTTTTTTTTTTAPTTTTTTTAPTTTAVPPPTTTQPPGVTPTIPPVTTQPPTTSPPSTTVPPVTAPPFEDDQRYVQKAELASHLILANSIMELPTANDQIPSPSPVTQIMASITTTAVTVRSHLLSAVVLGLMIAIGAIWGLGRRESMLNPVRERSSQ